MSAAQTPAPPRRKHRRTRPAPVLDRGHDWVGAALIHLDPMEVRRARRTLSVTVAEVTLDVLEVYCDRCRRPYDDAADAECVPTRKRQHLIGGPLPQAA